MLRRIDILTNAVKVTLGPKGRNVVFEKSYGAPRITKDGVTVAKKIELEDKFENMGAQMVREFASKTSDNAGDGTTRATVLTASMIKEGLKLVTAGMNPMISSAAFDLAAAGVVKDIERRAKKVQSSEEIAQVGTISANGDKAIGKMIADAMKKVGNEGGITVEKAKAAETEARCRGGNRVRPRLPLAVFHHQRREDAGRARGRLHPDPGEEALPRSSLCSRSSRLLSRLASRSSSSLKTSRGRRWRRWSSTSCAAASRSRRSRRRASAIAARRCWRTSRCLPLAA